MSKLLFKNNNMVVNGSVGKSYYCVPDSSKDADLRKNLFLQFIVKVNGDLVVHDAIFGMIKTTEHTGPGVHGWTLQNYGEWYGIAGLLTSFGYIFDESPTGHQSLDGWMTQLIDPNEK